MRRRRKSSTSKPQRPISWRRTLYATTIAQTLAIVGFSMRVPFLPFYLQDLGSLSIEQATVWSGLLSAGGAGVMTIAAPMWGVISDRHGRKPMVLRAMFASSITIALAAIVTAPWHLLGLRLVEGALAGTVTASTALVATAAPKERLGFSLGLVQTAVFSGASLGPLIGGVLADQIGYRQTFLASSAMLLVGGIIVVFFVQERFVPQPRGPERGIAALRAGTAWMLTPLIMTMIGMLFIIQLASSAVQPIIPLYIAVVGHEAAENASTMAGFALGVLGLTSAISAIYLGRMGDKIGHRRILVMCIFGAGLIYLPMAAVQAPWHMIILEGFFGIAAGGLIPAANALVGAVTAPERRGALYGVTSAASSFGGFIGPLAGAGIAASFGFRITFIIVAFILMALGFTAVRVFSRQPQSEDTTVQSAV